MICAIKPLRRIFLMVLGLGAAVGTAAFVLTPNPVNGLPNKWPPGPIRLRVLLGDTPSLGDGSTYNQNVATAAKAWNDAIGSVQFAVENSTGSPAQFNSVNEVAFATDIYGRDVGSFVFAVTGSVVRNNKIVEADVILNSTHTWDSYRGNMQPSRLDIQRIVLISLGRVLGLSATDPSTVSIMNPTNPHRFELSDDDIQGAQALYGPPGVQAYDNFTSARELVLNVGNGFGFTAFNTNCSKESGEPLHADNAGGRSVWFKWTAPFNARAALDTFGSHFDTTLGVYTGASVSTLTRIAANDDFAAPATLTSKVTFDAQRGSTYYFAVDGHDGDSASLMLNMEVDSDTPPPAITTQPASATVTSGSSVSFSVVATGTAPLSYQWSLGGTAISGATSATYSIASATSASAGTYSVTVSNAAGSVTSNNATLTVNTPAPAPAPSGGGGGGGAPSLWFVATLATLALVRRIFHTCSGKRELFVSCANETLTRSATSGCASIFSRREVYGMPARACTRRPAGKM